jgi:glucokinase
VSKQKNRYVMGFDLGGTKMMAVVYDEAWKGCGRSRRKTKGFSGAVAGLARIRDTIDRALEEAGIERDELAGIGIGVPGPLDPERGILLDLPNLGWQNVPIKAELEKIFKCQVVASNDVDAGTYAEYRFGAGQGKRCVLGVFPGTGIGGGCVYDGVLIRGKGISAMEIGHMCVLPNGPLCGCGRRGCLEAVASRLAIAQAAAAAAYRGEAPYLQSVGGTDLTKVRSGVLAKAIAEGDTIVEVIVRRAAGWLGVGIGSVVNLLAPDVVVLGGGLVEAMPEIYLEAVEKSARKHAMPAFHDMFEIKAAELEDDSTAHGAAAWADAVLQRGVTE